MMNHVMKEPKLEIMESVVEEDNGGGGREEEDEQEEALVALIEHRTKEVEHLKRRITYYNSQLEQAERRLHDSKSKLSRLRTRDNLTGSTKLLANGHTNVKVERRSLSPDGSQSRNHNQSRPQLLIPAVNPKIAQPVKLAESNLKASVSHGNRASPSYPTQSSSAPKLKGTPFYLPTSDSEDSESPDEGTKRKKEQKEHKEDSESQYKGKKRKMEQRGHMEDSDKGTNKKKDRKEHKGDTESPDKRTKRNKEQKEHRELIPLIRSSTSPCLIRCQAGVHISSQHKRKLRSLVLNPFNDQLFVTSALDGVVNFWQVQGKGIGASLLSSTDCVSPKQRRWPEDITWHPHGDSLFSVYTADGGDAQVSILNLNVSEQKKRVTFLEEKPHFKGIINGINFMPWDDLCFATGGSDHAVVLWREKDGENPWKPKALHRDHHSSAVMGIAGLQQKQILLSAGADKRIIGFDVVAGRAEFKHQIESKCMSILPNPSDFNLFMVQTGAPGKQLRLFDIRLRQTEIHEFGWKQEKSDSQSALINQAWSPDGLYISSGSADPVIHIFDIRYNAKKPSQSVKAHQKRVFKAVWHNSLPLLISISSDLNIGLHKIA